MTDPAVPNAPFFTRLRRRLHTPCKAGALLCLLTALAGLAVRATAFDQHRWSTPVTYAVPVPAAFWLMVFAALLQLVRGARASALAILAVAAGLGGAWSRGNFHRASSGPAPGTPLRFVFWNTAGPMTSWDRLFTAMRRHNPDVIALVEARPMSEEFYFALARSMPDFHECHTDQGLMLLARDSAVVRVRRSERGVVRLMESACASRGREARVVVADVASSPGRNHRSRAVEQVLRLVDEQSGPVILAGDFNTPADASVLAPLRGGMIRAFAQAGEGFDLTWPAPFPVMAIDHIWLRGWRAVRVRTDWTLLSDHAMLVADLEPVTQP